MVATRADARLGPTIDPAEGLLLVERPKAGTEVDVAVGDGVADAVALAVVVALLGVTTVNEDVLKAAIEDEEAAARLEVVANLVEEAAATVDEAVLVPLTLELDSTGASKKSQDLAVGSAWAMTTSSTLPCSSAHSTVHDLIIIR